MGHRGHRTAWGHLLDGLGADIALLQETVPPPGVYEHGQVIYAPAHATNPYSWGSAVYVRDGAARELPLPPEHRGWLVAAEVELPSAHPLVAVSIHASILPTVRPNIDRAFDALERMLKGRSFVVGGDLNLSRNYDKVYGTTHHTEFLDGLPRRGFFDCMQRFHAEEQQTFWGRTSNVYQNDHIFVSQDLAESATACEVADRAGASDHSPLKLTLG